MPFALLAAVLAPRPSTAQRSTNCDICRRPFSGEYVVYRDRDGRTTSVCESCQKAAPKCDLCGTPTKNRPISNGDHLCDACSRVAVGCQVCRELVRGQYREYKLANGARYVVCEKCANAARKCDACEVPFPEHALSAARGGTEKWCRHCLGSAEFCELCREPISGTGWKMQFTQGTWCSPCFEGKSKCYYCQRPMNEPARTAHAGHGMCGECAGHAVAGAEAFNQIARVVVPQMKELLVRDFQPPPIEPVSLGIMKKSLAEAKAGPDGDVTSFLKPIVPPVAHELGLFLAAGDLRKILVLDSLPEDSAWETVTHELAHSWQYEHYPEATDPLIVEGFAQWVADKICWKNFKRSGLERLYNRQDDYGLGLRLMTKVETEFGRDAVFRTLKENRFPGGLQPVPTK